MDKIEPLSLDRVKSSSLKDRASKVCIKDFGNAWRPGDSFNRWVESLPKVLAAGDFHEIVDRIFKAAASGKTILLGMGAHVIKVGLNPIILDLLNRRLINGVAMNGAGIIHDAEVAMIGKTSEDVAADLGTGRFGMAEETGKFLNAAISEGAKRGLGLGRSVGEMLVRENFQYNRYSLLASAFELGIPVTVHVGIGTDIIHFHPNVDGAAIGQTSHLDFRIFARLVSTLEKGCFINLGSAVILPEVFLKALTLVRNLGYKARDFTTINMDFIRHYRPMTNVVQRPTLDGGKGFNIVGHHEIMFPLLAAAVLERFNEA
ncbi:MAG: hypothetical protein R6V46_01315 [Desulfatiglandaceae bacterium]